MFYVPVMLLIKMGIDFYHTLYFVKFIFFTYIALFIFMVQCICIYLVIISKTLFKIIINYYSYNYDNVLL